MGGVGRRQLLRAAGSAALLGFAGCSGSGAETGSTGPSGGESTPGSDPTPTATVGATTETPNSLETVEVDDNWRDFQSDPAHTGTTDNAGPVTECSPHSTPPRALCGGKRNSEAGPRVR